ncbi:amino acid kinase family protein [Candidatus Thiosymbion oneisti]|uniref:amino acid kinase family protein n=1 Tax=Candidatus Thiosymbion oneisti TaxID=589554 RepID=UPI000B7CA255|nr:hypothetical protein [Candidatus Thiosymbion oneisti]
MATRASTSQGGVVVKLGGSLITRDTGTGPWLEAGLVIDLARELSALKRPLVLVHGTGAFGKPPAERYAFLQGYLDAERRAVVAEVAAHLGRYESRLIEHLLDGGLCPFRISTAMLMRGTSVGCRLANSEPIQDLLRHGVTLVVGGGFVTTPTGFGVCSSDDVASDLAQAIHADWLIFATRASGVYQAFGTDDRIYAEVDGDSLLDSKFQDGAERDVTGGMPAKVRAGLRASKRGIATFIIDGRVPGNIEATLCGRPLSGTRIRPR